MTRDHVDFILARIPAARFTCGSIYVPICGGLTHVAMDSRGIITIAGYGPPIGGWTSALAKEVYDAVTAMEAAIAASVEAGFPRIGEMGKDDAK